MWHSSPGRASSSLTMSGDRDGAEAVYFKRADIARILKLAREPYRTIFTLAWTTGFRAGELLGLTVADVDFERLMICPRKQADDRTRELRELKTKKSRTPVQLPRRRQPSFAPICKNHWKKNPQGLLFPNRRRSALQAGKRRQVGLHPVLKQLGIPTRQRSA